ncbi:MAG: signal recognition particle-docking protein FtsY [Lachnospiraceae bacterium]|nr:signal recognition particle-docking protein FtsY [Lachnospiraceae bacterium]
MGFFKNFFRGFSKIDDEFYEELEEVMVMGDIGIHATEELIETLKDQVKENRIKEPEGCRTLLMESVREMMQTDPEAYAFEDMTSAILVIGVNGVGKTTTIGKLAAKYKSQGKRVVLGAADTFRAAAGEQLTEWANRAGVDIVSGQEGSDPGAVVFDTIQAAKSRKADILLCDTAGRLHNKKNLMEELKKLNRILEREFPEAHRETLVVLDATTGQNALAQARQFSEVAEISGIILTKMDGTAKGGIAVAIKSELGIPVKYVGTGERAEDLKRFDADEFVEALFAQEEA